MSIEFPSQQSSKPDSTVERVRAGLVSAVSSAIDTLRVRFYSLRFGDWVSILLTLGAVAIAGTAFVGSTGALLAVGTGFTLALTLVMTNSSNPLLSSLGVGLSMLTGVLTAVVVGFAVYMLLQTGFSGLFVGVGIISLVLASTGAFLAPIRSISRLAIVRSMLVVSVGLIGVAGLIGVLVAPRAELRAQAIDAGVATGHTVISTLVSVDPVHALSTFFILLAAALFFVGRLVVRVPIERLLPADRRSTVVSVIEWVQTWRATLVRSSLLVAMITGLGLLLDATVPENEDAAWLLEYTQLLRTDQLPTIIPAPADQIVLGIVAAPSVRVALYGLIGGSVGVLLTARLLVSLRRGLAWTLVKLTAPLAGGIIAAIPFGILASRVGAMELLIEAAPAGTPPELVEFLQTVPAFVAGAAVVMLLLGLAVLTFLALGILATLIVLPANTGSTALASIGLFGVAVAAVVVNLPLVAVGVAAAALCVWDVGEFGATLRTELPDRTPTLRAETVHTSGSLLYCSVGAFGAWVLYQVAVPQVQPPAAEIAAVGLLGSLGIAALLALLTSQS